MKKNEKEKILKKLKISMFENGITQTELAKKLNLTQSAISAWFKGKGTPNLDTLLELSSIFKKPINYFFSDDSTTQNIIGNHNAQNAAQTDNDLKKELELLKAKQEVQALTIENLKLRLEDLERKK